MDDRIQKLFKAAQDLSEGNYRVDAHGGMAGVVSEPGHGATFWFDIP